MKGYIINEKNVRLRYTRALEKFIRSNISYLKDPEFQFDIFQKRVKRTFEILKKVEPIRLDSAYPMALENYANLLLNALEELNEVEKTQLKKNLLKEANLLHKEKNKTQYKKDKHKKSTFNDGY